MIMKFNSLKGLACLALLACGWSPAANAATAGGGDLVLGFRAKGVLTNYVVKVDTAAALRDGSSVRSIALPGVAADLATLFGAGWYDRTDLFWGVIANTSNFSTLNGDPAQTIYASKGEATNGVITSGWNRNGAATQSLTTTLISGFLSSGFNAGTPATNASAIAVTMARSASNSWSQYLPSLDPSNLSSEPDGTLSSGISFQTWSSPGIETTPGNYHDLFRMVSSTTPAEGDLVGRLVLQSTGELLFIPLGQLGTNSVSFASSSYSASEDAGVLDVVLSRTGDTSVATTVTLSTANGAALAGTDYTALTSQSVTFAALETTKTVHITIANRSGDQGSRDFTVSLGGNTGGTTIDNSAKTCTITEAPSTLQLSALTYTANQEDSSVTVRVSRTSGSAAVTVQLSTTNGTAVSGTDFTALTNQTVNIPSNTAFVDVAITLSHPVGTQPNKQFTVTLSNPGSGAVLDSDTSLLTSTVKILATDTVAPLIAFTAPALNAVVTGSVGGVLVVTGTASDAGGGLSKVEVSVDGVNFFKATVSGGTWTTASNGVNALKPAGGATTITARAIDFRNNTTTVTRAITYKITVPATSLTVNVVDVGGPTGTGASKVTGQLTGTAVYEIGKSYTFTATPGTNRAFDHWTIAGVTAPATEVSKITFVFTQAIANSPTITATFKANPYLATNNVSGAYTGLIKARSGTTASNATNGLITITQTGTAGAFTGTVKIGDETLGKMTIAATAVALAGVFDNDGVAKFGTTRATTVQIPRASGTPYVLSMSLNLNTKLITGRLNTTSRTSPAPQSDFTADHAAYSASAKVPDILLNKLVGTVPTSGYYTAVLPARSAGSVSLDPTVTFAKSEFPQGDGYTTIALTNAGIVTFSAVLGDGTAVTASSPLSATNKAIFFAQPYGSKGSIGGEVAVTKPTTFVEVAATGLFWFRPYQAVQHYPYGWPEGLLTDLVGSEYNVVSGTSVFPGLTSVASPNTNVAFSDGLLSPDLSLNFNIATTNVVSLTGTTLGVVIAPATGIIGGDAKTFFTHTDGTKTPFKAIIVQKGTNAGGWGHFLTTAPKVIDGLGESGGVTLTHN